MFLVYYTTRESPIYSTHNMYICTDIVDDIVNGFHVYVQRRGTKVAEGGCMIDETTKG